MADDIEQPAAGKPMEADDETLGDLELTEDSEAEGVAGGQKTVMCETTIVEHRS
jgi:hypothetical protein